jgi:DNA-binding protein YbaB
MAASPERPNWEVIGGMMDSLKKATSGISELQQRSRAITGEAWSDDGYVRALVGPRGQLLELELDPRVFRKPDSKALAALIVATQRNATHDALAKVDQLVQESLPGDLRPDRVNGTGLSTWLRTDDAALRENGDRDD